MRTYRSYHDGPIAAGATVELSVEEARHLTTVRRADAGDEVILVNGRGEEWSARVARCGKRGVELEVAALRRRDGTFRRTVEMHAAITRGDGYDELLQRCVELGAGAFCPVLTERTVVRWDAAKAGEKLRRWERIAIDALKQCERLWLPRIDAPKGLAESLADCQARGVRVVFLEERSLTGFDISDAVAPHSGEALALFVGPEGGWTEDEKEVAMAAGATIVTLGTEAILRAETAALAALVMATLGRWSA